MRISRIDCRCLLSSNSRYLSLAAISMSEDSYFGGDEDTSTELHAHGCSDTGAAASFTTPTPLQLEHDDMFEGEPDSSVFESPNSNNADTDLDQTTCTETGPIRNQGSVQQQSAHESPHTSNTASGGLGDGDVPYDENSARWRGQEAAFSSDDSTYREKDVQKDSAKTPEQWRQRSQQYGHRKSEWYSAYVDARALQHRQERLKELSGETFGTYRQENHTFSPSASSESVSISDDDEQHAQSDNEETEQTNTTQSSTVPYHGVQAVSSKTANVAGRKDSQPSSHGDNSKELANSRSSAASKPPSLPQSWTHLSEVTAADVEGHHPSVIARSARKVSRASSLASEGELGAAKETRPSTEPALYEKDVHAATRTLSELQGLDVLINLGSHLYPLPDKALSSRFRRPDARSSASSNRGSPPRRPAGLADAISVIAVTESPMPHLPTTPYRPDTPRPSADPERLEMLERSYAELRSPPMPASNSTSHESSASHTAYFNSQREPGNVRRVVPDPPPAVDFAIFIPHGRPTNYISPYVQYEIPQHVLCDAAEPTANPLTSSQTPPIIYGERTGLHSSWQFPRAIPESSHSGPFSIAPLLLNSIRLSDLGYAIRDLPDVDPEVVPIVRNPVLYSTTDNDVGYFTVPQTTSVPPLSEPSGLQDATQITRVSSNATTARRKPIKEPTSTRGRAVSHTRKKDKDTSTTSSASTTAVQGESVKVTKPRLKKPTRSTRSTSRKVTAPKHRFTVEDDVPEVPSVPEGMSSEVPNSRIPSDKIQMCTKRSRKGLRDSSSAHFTPKKTPTREKTRNKADASLPKTPSQEHVTSPSTQDQQLKVSKTRNIGKSATTISPMETPPRPIKTKEKTDSPHTQKYSPMSIDTDSPTHEQDRAQSHSQPQRCNKQAEPSTPSPQKRPASRKPTPGGIHKPGPRRPKTPVRLPTHKPNELQKLLHPANGDAHAEEPEIPTQTRTPTRKQTPLAKKKIKLTVTSRKATPAPRKKVHKEVPDDMIPPVPVVPHGDDRTNNLQTRSLEAKAGNSPVHGSSNESAVNPHRAGDAVPAPVTPKATKKSNTTGGEGGLMPQSAERGQSRTPRRCSPRLSGVKPGEGL